MHYVKNEGVHKPGNYHSEMNSYGFCNAFHLSIPNISRTGLTTSSNDFWFQFGSVPNIPDTLAYTLGHVDNSCSPTHNEVHFAYVYNKQNNKDKNIPWGIFLTSVEYNRKSLPNRKLSVYYNQLVARCLTYKLHCNVLEYLEFKAVPRKT